MAIKHLNSISVSRAISMKAVRDRAIPQEVLINSATMKTIYSSFNKIQKKYGVTHAYNEETRVLILEKDVSIKLEIPNVDSRANIQYKVLRLEGFSNALWGEHFVEIVVNDKAYRLSDDKKTWVESHRRKNRWGG